MAILWQCKNHHYRSKYPIVSLQECFRILQFKSGHPVLNHLLGNRFFRKKSLDLGLTICWAFSKKNSLFPKKISRKTGACFWSLIRSSTIANRRLNLVRACSKFDRRWSMVDDLIGDQKQAQWAPQNDNIEKPVF